MLTELSNILSYELTAPLTMEINVQNNIAKTIFKYDTKKEYLIMFPTIN